MDIGIIGWILIGGLVLGMILLTESQKSKKVNLTKKKNANTELKTINPKTDDEAGVSLVSARKRKTELSCHCFRVKDTF